MTSWHAKAFAMLAALAMLSLLAVPASAKPKHHRTHHRRGGHAVTHHKAPKH